MHPFDPISEGFGKIEAYETVPNTGDDWSDRVKILRREEN